MHTSLLKHNTHVKCMFVHPTPHISLTHMDYMFTQQIYTCTSPHTCTLTPTCVNPHTHPSLTTCPNVHHLSIWLFVQDFWRQVTRCSSKAYEATVHVCVAWVCICVYMCVYMGVYVCVHGCVCVCTWVCMCVNVCMCTYAYTHMYMCVFIISV